MSFRIQFKCYIQLNKVERYERSCGKRHCHLAVLWIITGGHQYEREI
ncbi:hypothetical protein DORFOR_02156 [Dorea formicigenerans ATCC 27755]|uniref:Uncharacterized protein n=1 Tax=Dorea formicigenerans ATCC 27755 TaxID=411461 RepID=B0G710_9FIRM|nr:hypothetical protein DORFOR_02156 [Dorea formicigenerans ATCC 27755]